MDLTTDTLPAEDDQAQRYIRSVLILDNITYVPHYTKRGTYVGPGGREFDADYLKIFGAKPQLSFLWARS